MAEPREKSGSFQVHTAYSFDRLLEGKARFEMEFRRLGNRHAKSLLARQKTAEPSLCGMPHHQAANALPRSLLHLRPRRSGVDLFRPSQLRTTPRRSVRETSM